MIALTVGTRSPGSSPNPTNYGIRLKIFPADREDAWDICQLALRYGGVEGRDCCFSFPNEECRLTALEALRFRFGAQYFQSADAAENA
jgi:hypothetical protein